MSYQEDTDNFTTHEVTQFGQDPVSHTTEVDGFVRSIEASSTAEITVTVTVAGDEVANYVGSAVDKGEFGDPITEIGADQTVEVSVQESEDAALNLVVDEYKG